jgi:hypothetical protein
MSGIVCANCGEGMPARANSGRRGPDIAWLVHCRECAELVGEQMDVVWERPGGESIEILRCRWCGTARTCRPGRRTRCMVCLDERSGLFKGRGVGDVRSLGDRFLRVIASAFEIQERQVRWQHVWEVQNYLVVQQRLEALARPEWTLLATDIQGLPFWVGDRSHGTWAQHDACGRIQKITAAHPECRTCPLRPESRTHRARADEPQLLYLVRYRNLLKFGHGDANRVRAHLRAGCTPVRVLRARHREVVAAELALKEVRVLE